MRLQGATRAEPDVPNSGIRLPPWVGDGEALLWPRMSDAGFGKPMCDEPVDRRPSGAVFLAAATEAPPPQPSNTAPEGAQCLDVVGHGMIGEVACHDLPQPGSLLVNRGVQAAAQGLLDLAQLGPQPVAPRLPVQGELAVPGMPADVGEAQEVEVY